MRKVGEKPRGIVSVAFNHLRRVDIVRKVSEALKDPRSKRNREWGFKYIVEVLTYAMLSGNKNLRAVETFGELYHARIPDTTLHDIITRIDATPLRALLVSEVKEALRAHELPRAEFPVRITAIDGKSFGTSQMPIGAFSKALEGGGVGQYKNMSLRACHVSNETQLLLGQRELPKGGESSEFIPFIDQLLADYGKTDLLEVISIDAGMVSKKNSDYLASKGLKYIMALKLPHMRLLEQAKKALKHAKVAAYSLDSSRGIEVRRELFRAPCASSHWEHLQEVWCVISTTSRKNEKKSIEKRYFVTNLDPAKLSAAQVLKAVRMHWRIENNAHWIFDTVWQEDDRPWATRALLFVCHLRMIAYNTISRLITRRSRDKAARAMSWHELLRCVEYACCRFAGFLTSRQGAPVFSV